MSRMFSEHDKNKKWQFMDRLYLCIAMMSGKFGGLHVIES